MRYCGVALWLYQSWAVRQLLPHGKKAMKCLCCSGCCRSKPRSRSRTTPSSGASTPRHENSETESEGEDGTHCQAESVAFLVQGKPTPLSLTACKDAARGDKVKLLSSDAEISSAEDLRHEDGNLYFNCCSHHRALYEGQAAKRTCAVEHCDREVKVTKGGLRLCKEHSAKEERTRTPKGRPAALTPTSRQPQIIVDSQEPDTEARFAPGGKASAASSRNADSAALLGRYLRGALEGKTPRESLELCTTANCGPHETWEELKEQATQYVTKLPKEYPPVAKKAIIELITEDCPPAEPSTETEDPVLGLQFRSVVPAAITPGFSAPETGLGTVKPETPAADVQNPQAFLRPKGSRELPAGMPSSNFNAMPDSARIFAAASRPRHIGAYSDAEPPHLDETSKALQTIAKAMASKDEAAGQDRGKLAAIGKVEERMVYLVRGCDAFSVSLGAATVGKELFHALRATSTQGRPQLRAMQFPVNISNRIAYGLAAMSIGGKDVKSLPEYCISAADFPLTGEEEFDIWTGSSDLKLEKRPKPPVTLNGWYRNALRQAWAIACVYGTEHYSSFEQAATFLLKLGEEHSYMWPAHAIFSVWEELWSRYTEEMRELDRNLRRAMKEEAPSFERMRFFATAPGEDGEPWLRLPRTFYLEDSGEYFQTDVLPRHNRLLSRACWQVALKKAPNSTLHGGKAGEGPEASDSRPGPKAGKTPDSKGLLGPNLTGKEAARALDHRPKDKKGAKYLCWDNLSHRGCNKPNTCPHSHANGLKWEGMDWAVQLQILRRGGLKSGPTLTEGQVTEQMEAIRKAQVAKTKEMVEEGKKVKKVGESESDRNPRGTHDQKVGQVPEDKTDQSHQGLEDQTDFSLRDGAEQGPPAELTEINPTDQEGEMVELLRGPDFSFYDDADAGKAKRKAVLTSDKFGNQTTARLANMEMIDQQGLTGGYQGLLATFLKNRLLKLKEKDPSATLTEEHVRESLEVARSQGGPELSAAADEALQGSSRKAGYSANAGCLSKLEWDGGVGRGTLTWSGGTWDVHDFGDRLQPTGEWTSYLHQHHLAGEGKESRQCLLLHCAAGYLERKNGRTPTYEEVQKTTNLLRAELALQAAEANKHLGECPETMPRSEADLRVFVHDLLHWSHDKDYRTMAAFPAEKLFGYDLHVVRMATDGDLSTEVIRGVLSPGDEKHTIYLLVHQGHMRLLTPRNLAQSPPVIREVVAAGWECHLEAATGSEASVRARDYLLCPRCEAPQEVPRRTGTFRPPAVLGLHLNCDSFATKTGGWTPGVLETHEEDDFQWNDEDVKAWLGDQAHLYEQALEHGLDFLEVYAGKGRATQAVLQRHGIAICLGLDYGQDFRRARDRSLARFLVERLRPRHLWGSFPCKAFCAWIRLAILRNCDMGPRLKEGRLHLKFTLGLVTKQLEAGRHGHLENPLTSAAWKEPAAIKALADARWLRARLDQCQTGLSSPLGGLHLKPTLIRTTDTSMAQVLSLVCPHNHPHDPVAGAATATSAMYSPHMASLIAQVVMPNSTLPPQPDPKGQGGERAFNFERKSGCRPRGEFLARGPKTLA